MTPSPQPEYREIKLTQGQIAIVDAGDFERLNKHKWHARWSKYTQSYYAMRGVYQKDGSIRAIAMQRDILGLLYGDPRVGDHRLRNTLDNRRFVNGEINLRIVTKAQNNQNRRIQRNNTSGYRGVKPQGDKWVATIQDSGKQRYLGIFLTAERANQAVRGACIAMHGRDDPMG